MPTKKKAQAQEKIPDFLKLYSVILDIVKDAEANLPPAADIPRARKGLSDFITLLEKRMKAPGSFPVVKVFASLSEVLLYGFFSDFKAVIHRINVADRKIAQAITELGFALDAESALILNFRLAFENLRNDITVYLFAFDDLEHEQAATCPGKSLDELLIESFDGKGDYKPDSTFRQILTTATDGGRRLDEAAQAIKEAMANYPTQDQLLQEEEALAPDSEPRKNPFDFKLDLHQFGIFADDDDEEEPEDFSNPLKYRTPKTRALEYIYSGTKFPRIASNPEFITPAGIQEIQKYPVSIWKSAEILAGIKTPDGEPLTDFDFYVLGLIYSFANFAEKNGRPDIVITPEALYRFDKTASATISQPLLREYADSLQRLRKTDFEADITNHIALYAKKTTHSNEEAKAKEMEIRAAIAERTKTPFSQTDSLIIGGSLFPASRYSKIKRANGTEVTFYTFSVEKEPALLAYSKATGQLKNLPQEFLAISVLNQDKTESPLKMTKERVEIRQYLLDRFYQASGQNANASDRTILCTTLYERFNCGQDRIVKKRLRDFVEAVLKHWTRCLAKCGIGLEKYEVRKKAGQIEAFIITVGKN